MKKIYLSLIAAALFSGFLFSCSGDEESDYVNVSNTSADRPAPVASAPITLDLTQVPFPKLSDYHFFVGNLKDLKPGYLVIPFEPASSLFSDYAKKKRFVWIPKGTHASYDGDGSALNFPVGAVLIKNFYYEHVQPGDVTKIIETRLLVRKSDGWKMYDYIWNEAQTDALLDVQENGMFVPITWIENGQTRTIDYKIPSQTDCATCHKLTQDQTEITVPIGAKPQNLNTTYNYGSYTRNQLERWKSIGYIDNTLPPVASIYSSVDWRDTSKSLELRARSYIDINCAHCHNALGHCAYVPQRFNFSNTNLQTFGVCLAPLFQVNNNPYVIYAGDANHSAMVSSMNTNDESQMMPLLGRTIIHDEGVQLMKDWINSLPHSCN